jgi:hypothetical protein
MRRTPSAKVTVAVPRVFGPLTSFHRSMAIFWPVGLVSVAAGKRKMRLPEWSAMDRTDPGGREATLKMRS